MRVLKKKTRWHLKTLWKKHFNLEVIWLTVRISVFEIVWDGKLRGHPKSTIKDWQPLVNTEWKTFVLRSQDHYIWVEQISWHWESTGVLWFGIDYQRRRCILSCYCERILCKLNCYFGEYVQERRESHGQINMNRIPVRGVMVDLLDCTISRFLHGEEFVPPTTTREFYHRMSDRVNQLP